MADIAKTHGLASFSKCYKCLNGEGRYGRRPYVSLHADCKYSLYCAMGTYVLERKKVQAYFRQVRRHAAITSSVLANYAKEKGMPALEPREGPSHLELRFAEGAVQEEKAAVEEEAAAEKQGATFEEEGAAVEPADTAGPSAATAAELAHTDTAAAGTSGTVETSVAASTSTSSMPDMKSRRGRPH